MLINCDVKSLEVVVAAELANDAILKEEIVRKLDLHALNQQRFNLPDRVTAKRFIFKLLYGATAYGYSVDSDFLDVGYSEKQWQGVIDDFYNKYVGIGKWHKHLLETVMSNNGIIEIPSGRQYYFEPTKHYRGWKWPLTKIKNYPVQGFGADLVKLARIKLYNDLKNSGLEGLFIQTIHDSLVVDTPEENVYNISVLMKKAVEAVPEMCKLEWGYNFSLPMTSEILVGPNKRHMEELKI